MSYRKRIVRKTEETESTFETFGYFLTEKMKNKLRKSLGKTTNMNWTDVFTNSDVVYRWNPAKGKQDVFVGLVNRVKYPSGKKETLKVPANFYLDLQTIEGVTGLDVMDRTNHVVSYSNAKRGSL